VEVASGYELSEAANPAPPSAASSPGLNGRIPALDGLRAVASLMVVFCHFGPHLVRSSTSDFTFLHFLPRSGGEGVDLFFVLSGFLISGILVNARSSPSYFSTFYIRRALRIFPLYYLVLMTYVAAVLLLGLRTASFGRLFENPLPTWTYFLYVQNFAMAAASSFGAIWMAGSWSLAIEEQFYFTLPAIVRRVSDRTLVWVGVLGLVGPIFLRASIQKFKFAPQLSNRVLLPTAVDALAAGVLVMLLLRHRADWLADHRKQLGRIVLAALVCWFFYPAVPNPQAIRMAFLDSTATAIVCGGVLLYILTAPHGWLGRFLSLKWMRTLGNMAYSTYLFHPILLCLAFQIIRSKDPLLNSPSDLLPIFAAGVATAALSFASWQFFESKLIRYGHRWRY
jgi:peptidoglycan/LPS O-acetylase OafA/YrhL